MERSGQSPAPQRRFLDVAQGILASINAGDYARGAKLPGDRDLAAAHKVSRQTTREALLALELIGAITIRHGDGVYVSPPTAGVDPDNVLLNGEPRDVIESRCALEPITTRLAAARISNDQLARLQANVDEADRIGGDPAAFKRFMELGLDFHAALARCCGNDLLAEIVGQLVSVERHPLWVLVNEQALRSRSARLAQVEQHRGVVEALHARDVEKAEHRMRTHLTDLESAVFLGSPFATGGR